MSALGGKGVSDSAAPDSGVSWSSLSPQRTMLQGLLVGRDVDLALIVGPACDPVLELVAETAGEVRSFDREPPPARAAELGNVVVHTGDCVDLLPNVLAGFADADRSVDLVVMVGGDWTDAERVGLIDGLFDSMALSDTLVVFLDAMRHDVRAVLDQVVFGAWPVVDRVTLDLLPGRIVAEGEEAGRIEGGIGIVTTLDRPRGAASRRRQANRYVPGSAQLDVVAAAVTARWEGEARRRELVREIGAPDQPLGVDPLLHAEWQRDDALGRLGVLEAEYLRLEAAWSSVVDSFSWKLTRPLRGAKVFLKRLLG